MHSAPFLADSGRLDAAAPPARRGPRRISFQGVAVTCALSDLGVVLVGAFAPLLLYGGIAGEAWDQYLPAIALALALYPAMTQLTGAYRIQDGSARTILWRGIGAVALTFSVIVLVSVATKTTGSFSRIWLFSWLGLTLCGVAAQRILAFAVLENRLAAGACLNRALIVSTVRDGLSGDQVAAATANRTRAAGRIQIDDVSGASEVLDRAIRQHQPDTLILEVPWSDFPVASAWLRSGISNYALNAFVVPAGKVEQGDVLRLSRLGSHVMFQTVEEPISGWRQFLKRSEDLGLSALGLFVLAPLFLLVALAIKIESRGPVFFRQVRGGFNGGTFFVWKFRSMYADMSDAGASRQTSKGDPRVTRIGRFIRRTSIDELPQLFNVLNGTMSLVGPRPHALQTTAEGQALEAVEDRYAARHRVKPGITGWAQVNGLRGELDSIDKLRRRVEYDIHYIENWSLALDVKIILMTALRMVYDPKAY